MDIHILIRSQYKRYDVYKSQTLAVQVLTNKVWKCAKELPVWIDEEVVDKQPAQLRDGVQRNFHLVVGRVGNVWGPHEGKIWRKHLPGEATVCPRVVKQSGKVSEIAVASLRCILRALCCDVPFLG